MRSSVIRLLVCFWLVGIAFAQDGETPTRVNNANRTGELPYAPTIGTGVETVDLATGTLNVKVPIVSVPGRGMGSELYFRFNSKFLVTAQRIDGLGNPYNIRTREKYSGWQTNAPRISSVYKPVQCQDFGHTTEQANFWMSYIYTDASGAKHPLALRQSSGGYCAGPNDDAGPDLTGLGIMGYRSGASAVVRLSDGTSVSATNTDDWHHGFGTYEDSNGNVSTSTTDTSGRPFYAVVNTIDPTTLRPIQDVYTVRDSSGTARIYTVNWQRITIFAGSTNRSQPQSSMDVLSSVVLPNGTSYSFTYDDGNYGDLTRITLPTGAYIDYTYAEYTPQSDDPGFRYVSSRTEHFDNRSATWTISVASVNYDHELSTLTFPPAVSYPSGGSSSSSTATYQSYQGNVEDVTIFSESGTKLREYKMTYASDSDPFVNPCWDTNISPPPPAQMVGTRLTSVTTILDNNLQSVKKFFYEPVGQTFTYTFHAGVCPTRSLSAVATAYTTSRGNVYQTEEYDWAGTTPLRTTVKTYLHDDATVGSAYRSANIVDKVLQQNVYDGGSTGGLVAQTKYEFDKYTAPNPAMINADSAANHDATSYSTTTTIRGNVTAVKAWRDSDGSGQPTPTDLSTVYEYDSAGNMRSIKDPGGHKTTYVYDDAFDSSSASSCLPASNSLAFVTEVDDALSHATKFKRYACTGKVQARTDANDITAGRVGTTFQYDLFGRLSLKTNSDGGTISNVYQDGATSSVTETTQLDTSRGRVIETDLDQLGRPRKTVLSPGQSNAIYTRVSYDSRGRKVQEWNPTRCDPDANPTSCTGEITFGVTSTQYDVLGRVTKVVPPDGADSTNNVSTNYIGKGVTVTDQALKSRVSYTDALGRLEQVDEPSGPIVAATAGRGNINVTGSLQSTYVPASTAGSAWVTISGSQHQEERCTPAPCRWVYDSGTVTVKVNGAPKTVNYASSATVTATTVANALRSAIQNDTNYPVNAGGTGTTITLTARTTGSSTNYTLTTQVVSNSPNLFNPPVFSAGRSGANLTGGSGQTGWPGGTVWDTGTYTVNVGGHPTATAYAQPNTSSSSMATAIAGSINGDTGALVTAQATGSAVTLTSKATGAASNYSWTVSSNSSQSQYFAQPSFNASPSSDSLMGGANASGGLLTPWTTRYFYNVLDNLTCVEQHGDTASGSGCSADPANDATSPWRVRRFAYNSLGQLLTAKNPESGTITYAYDDDGNVTSKTSPAPNQAGAATLTVNYAYDALHRLTGKSYSNGDSAVAYLYDQSSYNGLAIGNGIGRRTGMSDASGQTAWTYDVMGRALKERRTIAGVTKELAYEYNLDGSAKKLTYPSGAVVNFAYDPAGRLLSAIDPANNLNYAQSAAYTPAGALSALTLGNSGSFAGYTLANTYNNRLQPTLLSAAKPGATLFSRFYSYGAAQQNNGNISQITDNLVADRSVSYTYDQLNRIASAQSTGTDCSAVSGAPALTKNWGNSYTIDPWGNLTAKNVTKCSSEALSTAVSVKNQLGVGAHDAAGNLLNNGGASYGYDAENRMAATAGVNYVYDGDGVRVKKDSGTLYWGESFTAGPIAETDLSGTIKAEYVYFGGRRIARRDYPCASPPDQCVHYYFSDHLNSTNLVYSATGTIEEDSDFYPYGSERACSMGRFMSPDSVSYSNRKHPQSWNLYAFALNNPVTFRDADGKRG